MSTKTDQGQCHTMTYGTELTYMVAADDLVDSFTKPGGFHLTAEIACIRAELLDIRKDAGRWDAPAPMPWNLRVPCFWQWFRRRMIDKMTDPELRLTLRKRCRSHVAEYIDNGDSEYEAERKTSARLAVLVCKCTDFQPERNLP